jgi:hypothetical protein
VSHQCFTGLWWCGRQLNILNGSACASLVFGSSSPSKCHRRPFLLKWTFKYVSNVTNITSKSYVHPSFFFKMRFQCSHKSFVIFMYAFECLIFPPVIIERLNPQPLEFRTPLFPHLVPPTIMVWIFVWKYSLFGDSENRENNYLKIRDLLSIALFTKHLESLT